MRSARLRTKFAAAAGIGAVMSVFAYSGLAAPASAATDWAPEDQATITPGVQMYTNGAQCTANFVFTDDSGAVYVGYAAHCAGTGSSTDTDGCSTKSLAMGTKVVFREGGNVVGSGEKVGTGRLAYSSWKTMQDVGESNTNACTYNDLALVEVDPGSVDEVNPTVPFWGGPDGLAQGGTTAGDKLYTYGNSSLRADIDPLSPKVGFSVGNAGNGWSHNGYTVTPGVSGDSGSGFMNANGNAMGVLSTLALAPLPASNGIGDLAKQVDYANAHSELSGLELVPGTSKFDPVL